MGNTYFITGATGQQGGHTARILLSQGHQVRTIARDPSSSAAQELQSLGATVLKGDFTDVDSLRTAAEGCVGVFINVLPVFSDHQAERKHAQNVLKACEQAGVRNVVYSSIANTEKQDSFVDFDESGWMGQHYASKTACEEAVRNTGGLDSWTIFSIPRLLNSYVAPSTDMMFPELAQRGVIRTALRPDLKQAVIDPQDIGKFAAAALTDDSGRFRHAVIPLAAEDLTIPEIVASMNKALGEERVKLEYLNQEEVDKTKDSNPMVAADLFMNANGMQVDSDRARQYSIKMNGADAFFCREKDALKRALVA